MQEEIVTNNESKAQELGSLALKMAKVMGGVNNLPKDGTNKHFGYSFVSDTVVFDAVRKQLVEHNLIIMPSIIDHNTIGNKTVIKMSFTIVDGDSGESMVLYWVNEANDSQDKGISKAVTLGLKYFLKALFIIPTGDLKDDPDYSSEDTKPAKKTKSAPPPEDTLIDVDPFDELRRKVHKELDKSLSDDDIAKLAGVSKFDDPEAWRKQYTSLGEAFTVIKAEFTKPAEPKADNKKGDGGKSKPDPLAVKNT